MAAGRERAARLIIKALAVYASVIVTLVAVIVLIGSQDPLTRAITLMALGLVLSSCLVGGALTFRYQDSVRGWMLHLNLRWEWRFLPARHCSFSHRSGDTTTMTNPAPEFGSKIRVGYITASSNYLVVIGFSSVVLFVPEFAGWILLLRRWDFRPNEVLLLYGLRGTTMEASLNSTALYSGFWFFMHGLMVYLPAYSLPSDRLVAQPRWSHYVQACVLPFAWAISVAAVDSVIAHRLDMHLWA